MWKKHGRPQLTAHAHCVSGNWGRSTRRIFKTYCFSTATNVTRTLFNVKWNVHFLSCFASFLQHHIHAGRLHSPSKQIHAYSSTLPTAAHYLQQQITYSNTLPTAAHYLQQHITYSSTLPTAAHYLRQHFCHDSPHEMSAATTLYNWLQKFLSLTLILLT